MTTYVHAAKRWPELMDRCSRLALTGGSVHLHAIDRDTGECRYPGCDGKSSECSDTSCCNGEGYILPWEAEWLGRLVKVAQSRRWWVTIYTDGSVSLCLPGGIDVIGDVPNASEALAVAMLRADAARAAS